MTLFTVADCGAGLLGLLGCVVCWKRRAIPAGVCSSAAVALTAASIASGQRPRPAVLLVLDVIVLTIAPTLLTLGQAIGRLLDESFNQDS